MGVLGYELDQSTGKFKAFLNYFEIVKEKKKVFVRFWMVGFVLHEIIVTGFLSSIRWRKEELGVEGELEKKRRGGNVWERENEGEGKRAGIKKIIFGFETQLQWVSKILAFDMFDVVGIFVCWLLN